MRQIVIDTLEGTRFVIKFDNRADRCWSMRVPHIWSVKLGCLMKSNDFATHEADGSYTWYSGSVGRLMDAVAGYVCECEA